MPKSFFEKEMQMFDETICPCRWIITTPEHKKKDCPHYTFSEDKSFLAASYGRFLDEVVGRADKLKREVKYEGGTDVSTILRNGDKLSGYNDALSDLISSLEELRKTIQ